MLKKLDIPDDDAAVLKSWLAGDTEPTDAVLGALEKAAPALRWKALAAKVAADAKVTTDKVEPLILSFLNLVNTIAHWEEDDRKEAGPILFHSLVGDVADTEQREKFLKRFKRVMEANSVEITGKALGVQQEDARSFCTARLISQLRPVFSDEDLVPKATVVVHQLKVVYHTGPEDERDEIFVAMTRNDLELLREVVDRALQKHDKLLAVAKQAGIPTL